MYKPLDYEVQLIQEYGELINTPQKVDFRHVAEGRANVVFSIWETGNANATPSRLRFEGTLLRVPKVTKGVTPCNYVILQDFYMNQVIKHVGRQHIVPQELVRISAEVADILNARRARNDGSVIRRGHGMLIQDMGESPGYKVLEFKPKWLAQSPLAPPNAIRCRTCAREAFRNSTKQAQGLQVRVPICPLGLVCEQPAIVARTIERLTPGWTSTERSRLLYAFEKSGILKKLREIQMRGDSGRALFDDPGDLDFGLAMTLRDCSCFIRMPADFDNEVEIKLADVDKKNWEEKTSYWRESHYNLVHNGWYTGEEKLDKPVLTDCALSRFNGMDEGLKA